MRRRAGQAGGGGGGGGGGRRGRHCLPSLPRPLCILHCVRLITARILFAVAAAAAPFAIRQAVRDAGRSVALHLFFLLLLPPAFAAAANDRVTHSFPRNMAPLNGHLHVVRAPVRADHEEEEDCRRGQQAGRRGAGRRREDSTLPACLLTGGVSPATAATAASWNRPLCCTLRSGVSSPPSRAARATSR